MFKKKNTDWIAMKPGIDILTFMFPSGRIIILVIP